jgi:DNA-binding transcriptional MerR regulator
MRDFTFSPPNRGALWSMLALTKTQLAELCNLTTRQVSHWTNQGYITTSGRNPERYNGDAVDLCILIKQGLDNGVPLRRSVRMAREYIAAELQAQPEMRIIEPPALLDIREKLRGAGSSIESVLQVVDALIPREVEAAPVDDRGALVTTN